MASEKISFNLDKLGTVHKKGGKIYVELNPNLKPFEGNKGNYIDLVRWENESPDQYGNTSGIQLDFPMDYQGSKVYVGNGKPLKKSGAPAPQQPNLSTPEEGDLPF